MMECAGSLLHDEGWREHCIRGRRRRPRRLFSVGRARAVFARPRRTRGRTRGTPGPCVFAVALIRDPFDFRGCGLSDTNVENLSLDVLVAGSRGRRRASRVADAFAAPRHGHDGPDCHEVRRRASRPRGCARAARRRMRAGRMERIPAHACPRRRPARRIGNHIWTLMALHSRPGGSDAEPARSGLRLRSIDAPDATRHRSRRRRPITRRPAREDSIRSPTLVLGRR